MSTLPLELLKASSSPADGECAAGTISQLTPKIAKWEYAIEGSPLWPSNLIERVIEAVHLYSDLSWGGTIVVYTILMRALLLPALVKQTRSTILANNLRPMVQQMQSEVQLLRNQGRKEESYRKLQDMSKFMSERGINPAGILGLSILPLPFFMSTFFALRNMAKQPVASLLDGGPFWFENLTIPDPYYILPIVSTISLISTLEISRKFSPTPNISYGMALGIRVFAAASLPGLVLYFCVSNIISCIAQAVLAIPRVRRFLRIPAVKPVSTPVKSVGFLERFKESYRAHLTPASQSSSNQQGRVIHMQKPRL